jgi:GR25 family glycosyltransferase involved in LPS biosynthesis
MIRKSNLHRIAVKGVGRLTVRGRLPKYRKTVLVEGREYPITKQKFMEAWALSRRGGRSFRELLAERITEPKSKLSPVEKFSQEVSFQLGAPVDEGALLNYFERGLSVEQAVNALRAETRARVKQKEERVW